MRKNLFWSMLMGIGFALANPLTAMAQSGTPTAATVEFQQTASLPWYVGVLFFVFIAVGVTFWKTRLIKETKQTISVNACAPLPDDDLKSAREETKTPEK